MKGHEVEDRETQMRNFAVASWQQFTDRTPAHWGRIRSAHRELMAGEPARRASNSRPASRVERPVVRPRASTQSRAQGELGLRGRMPRILIVDNDVDAANALGSSLQAAGYGEARVAHTGASALALAIKFVPTILLIDLELPDMSGYDVARHLSQHPQLQNLRLIALTANNEHPGRELAREAGIERYVIKPVSAADLDELFT